MRDHKAKSRILQTHQQTEKHYGQKVRDDNGDDNDNDETSPISAAPC